MSTLGTRANILAETLGVYDNDGFTYDTWEPTYDNAALITGMKTLGVCARISSPYSILAARANILNTGVKTVSGKARIGRVSIETVSAGARMAVCSATTLQAKTKIAIRYTKTTQMRGRVIPTISGQARILRHQGWPVIEVGEEGYEQFTDTGLVVKASLSTYIAFPMQSMNTKARIWYGKTWKLNSQANITPAQHFQVRAFILPPFYAGRMSVSFSISQVTRNAVAIRFYSNGQQKIQAFQAGCYIVRSEAKRMTGHFLVVAPPITSSVVSMPNPQTFAGKVQFMAMQARVVKQ
jgi:hypothetical protein